VIMPPVGLALGGVDFTNMFVTLRDGAKAAGPYASLADAKDAGAVTLNYGSSSTRSSASSSWRSPSSWS
jgi:large conductance mechanosensitive channel